MYSEIDLSCFNKLDCYSIFAILCVSTLSKKIDKK